MDDLDKLPGLKRRDIQPCKVCGKGVLHTGIPIFYRVTVEQFVADARALQRQHGLELMLGSPALAQVMGPDQDLAKRMNDARPVLLCHECADKPHVLMLGLEHGNDQHTEAA